MKYTAVWKMIGIVALVLASLAAYAYIRTVPRERLASLMGITLTFSDINAGIDGMPRESQRPPSESQPQPNLGTVVVQTFSRGTLIQQGAGTVLSSDGLILTMLATAPYGAGSYTYQVLTTNHGILRAQRVFSDGPSGIALLKVEATDLPAVPFESVALEAGAQYGAVSAQAQLSAFVSVRAPLWVISISTTGHAQLSFDRALTAQLSGARVIDRMGRTIGVMRVYPQVTFIDAAMVNAVVDRYLATLQTQP